MANNQLAWADDPQGYIGNAVGVPVTVTSGFRTPQHNAAVGGVPNSAHLTPNQAYDFVPKGMSTADAANRLVQSGVPFDQVYDENNHVHVSFAPAMRRQVISPKGSMAQPAQTSGPSDDDIISALTGGTPKSAAPSAQPANANGPSDDDIIKALTGGGPAKTPPSAAPKKAPISTGEKVISSKPFGFGDEFSASIPFGKDVVAGGLAALDYGANKLTGAQNQPGFGDMYHANMGALNQQQAQYEKDHNILAPVAQGLGIMSAGTPGPGSLTGPAIKQSLGALVKGGAKAGATIGGLFGLGTNTKDNETVGDRLTGAAEGAATGGLAGGVIPLAGAGLAATGRAVGSAANKLFPAADAVAFNRARGIVHDFAGGPIAPNPSEIVPGSKPTLAESVNNPGVSLLQKQIAQINPNSPLLARQAENAVARNNAFEAASGIPEDVDKAVAARNTEAAAARNNVFANPYAGTDHADYHAAVNQPDITPVKDEISSILNGSSGNRPAVKSAMSDVQSMMKDSDGNDITDPKTLYDSVRKGINDLIGGKDLTKAYGATAASQLIKVRDALDDAIETKAPGFKDYLSNYEESSGPIDAMKFLQGLPITDNQGNITLAKVQTAIKRLEAQQAAPGVKQGKAVSDVQQKALESIRDDLLRKGNLDMGRAAGSDTKQNFSLSKKLGLEQPPPTMTQKLLPEFTGAGIGTALGAGIGHLTGIPALPEMAGGYLGDRIGKALFEKGVAKRAAANSLVQGHLENMMLNPSAYSGGAPSIPQASLNDIINGSKMRTANALANRLAIMHQLNQKSAAGSP